MSKYTAEQARSSLQKMHGHPLTVAERAELFSMASNYAALLRERESAVVPEYHGTTCSLDEALNVIERWARRGNTLSGDDVERFVTIADRIAPRAGSESSEELKEWEKFGREIEKRLRYNPWGFKGSYPEIIDQIMKMASARVPDGWQLVPVEPTDGMVRVVYPLHWYDGPGHRLKVAYKQMLAAAPKPEKE